MIESTHKSISHVVLTLDPKTAEQLATLVFAIRTYAAEEILQADTNITEEVPEAIERVLPDFELPDYNKIPHLIVEPTND